MGQTCIMRGGEIDGIGEGVYYYIWKILILQNREEMLNTIGEF